MIPAWRHGYGIDTFSQRVDKSGLFGHIPARCRRPSTCSRDVSKWCGHFEWRLCRRLKPDFPLWRIRWQRRRVQDLHEILKDVDDGCFVRVEPAGELFLQCFELFRQLARAKQRLAHFYESTDDKHVDSRSPDRSVASPCDQCSPSNGVPARRIHLDRARAAKNIRRL